ncbi:trans-sulfuration enzyme family protein [Geosporobacter ferrireducens]|uniref:trans-sulfuration enzyme family protein n=1 Tax=Geosporobacter ferrireducens TaxID=1424294 RepID=UPI00139EC158|nr:PLP-dependent aspartate aminotransferase family protein [Geosporobacter ferrireducens]MTI58181.1 PLP-dependent transferase [Geosporobacter ferrireducens]
MTKRNVSIETKVVHGSQGGDPHTGAISFPIYQSATFRHPALNQSTGYDYSRVQNPTREELEKTIAILEEGSSGFAFSSGMAAIHAILELFSTGDHLILSDDLYGGTYRICQEIYRKHGLEFTFTETGDLENIKRHIKSNTKGIFIETPSNPLMKVADIAGIVDIAQKSELITIVDNTFLTPYFQRPLALGADIAIHSGTKYLGGHNDTLAGLIVIREDHWKEKIQYIQKSIGANLSPFDSWLILRGIKTLGIRLEKQQKNALEIAQWLNNHPKVEKVYYTGLTEHESYDLSCKQASGFGGMISFSVTEAGLVGQILERVRLIAFAESLGGVESLITYPFQQTHAEIPQEMKERLGVTEKLLRLSVGIESIEDLLEDLEQSMK